MRRFVKIGNPRGERAVISPDGQRARRTEPVRYYDCATVCVEPAFDPRVGPCYFEVAILEHGASWSGSVKLRFTETDPQQISKVAGPDEPTNDTRHPGVDFVVGTRIGLLLEAGRSVYFVNGKRLAVVEFLPDVPMDVPLHGIVDVYAKCIEVMLVQPLAWSEKVHAQFPAEFRSIAKTLLLCHRRQEPPNLVSTLPKFVLLDIISLLGDHYGAFRLPEDVLRRQQPREKKK